MVYDMCGIWYGSVQAEMLGTTTVLSIVPFSTNYMQILGKQNNVLEMRKF